MGGQTKVLCDECDELLSIDQVKPCPFKKDSAFVCIDCCQECGYNEDGDCTFTD